ncbi:MAG: HD domain-containing protein [Clostridia bacterium]|nr:HD domain-containing protein [Clostridia bacterium]
MRLVGIKSLSIGDTLALPVTASSGKIILNAGVVLTDVYIDKLKHLGIHKVYINDGRFDDVEVIEQLDLRVKNNAMQVLRETNDKILKSKEVDEYLIKDIAKDIVEYVRTCKDRGVNILSTEAIDDYVIEHSLNVALLTAYLGNRMNFNYNQLCDLVTGALIHDLGRENISDEKPEHVQKGFDILRKCRGLSLHSSIVCYEHHENFDGTGYPRKLKGSAISEFTRVIKVADVYDNVLHGYENNNNSVMPHQAYEYVMAFSGSKLDPEIVQHFRDTIVFFPNGCTVLLSNGLKGVIIRQNLGSPQRPVIRIYNETSVIGEIDLLKSLTLFIKDVVVI